MLWYPSGSVATIASTLFTDAITKYSSCYFYHYHQYYRILQPIHAAYTTFRITNIALTNEVGRRYQTTELKQNIQNLIDNWLTILPSPWKRPFVGGQRGFLDYGLGVEPKSWWETQRARLRLTPCCHGFDTVAEIQATPTPTSTSFPLSHTTTPPSVSPPPPSPNSFLLFLFL